jgi:UDP-N-acetyl-D-mannosaminuronic acid dehydrogenase
MAALLAHADIRIGGAGPARVTVVQRASPTSGWKVDAINRGISPVGGVEPELDRLVRESVAAGRLAATHDTAALEDADVVVVAIQTDRIGDAPDYGPLFEGLHGVATALQRRPAGNLPLVIIESTLAPSSLGTVVRELFEQHDLVDGRDVLLGHSPNRVMPGRLVERVRTSDKLVAGLRPLTAELIRRLYAHVVRAGTIHPTNAMTAEIVKTLENAYRDVRIAFATEVARYCDAHGIDFHAVRERVNEAAAQVDAASQDPGAIPTGALLIPTVGVGGHCLPKDGILLWWRLLEAGEPTAGSLILEARHINDESPRATLALAERRCGSLAGRAVAVLGAAYRGDSEDTRNSPSLVVADLLGRKGCDVRLHDPFVRTEDVNLQRMGLARHLTRNLAEAVAGAEVALLCTAHAAYRTAGVWRELEESGASLFDACNALPGSLAERVPGIGRGGTAPEEDFIAYVRDAFTAVERGVANELNSVVQFLNRRYAPDEASAVRLHEVARLAGTCATGCRLVAPGSVDHVPAYGEHRFRLAAIAAAATFTATSGD